MLEVGFEVGLLCCFVVVWWDALFGGHVLSVCGLCWFVFLICSLIIGGIVCLAVCLMRFLRCLNLLAVLGFDVIGLICWWLGLEFWCWWECGLGGLYFICMIMLCVFCINGFVVNRVLG